MPTDSPDWFGVRFERLPAITTAQIIEHMLTHAIKYHRTPEARVALRCAYGDAAHICDAIARDIERANPGRKKGSASHIAQWAAAEFRKAGDRIWEMRERIEVPRDGRRVMP